MDGYGEECCIIETEGIGENLDRKYENAPMLISS